MCLQTEHHDDFVSQNLANNGSQHDLLPNGTKALPEPMLTYSQPGLDALVWEPISWDIF